MSRYRREVVRKMDFFGWQMRLNQPAQIDPECRILRPLIKTGQYRTKSRESPQDTCRKVLTNCWRVVPIHIEPLKICDLTANQQFQGSDVTTHLSVAMATCDQTGRHQNCSMPVEIVSGSSRSAQKKQQLSNGRRPPGQFELPAAAPLFSKL